MLRCFTNLLTALFVHFESHSSKFPVWLRCKTSIRRPSLPCAFMLYISLFFLISFKSLQFPLAVIRLLLCRWLVPDAEPICRLHRHALHMSVSFVCSVFILINQRYLSVFSSYDNVCVRIREVNRKESGYWVSSFKRRRRASRDICG